MLQLLTGGEYDSVGGVFRTPAGEPRYYRATDNLQSERYRRLTPDDLIDIAVERGLHFHAVTQHGVVFHLIGALSGYGKLGVVCVAVNRAAAAQLFDATAAVLDEAAA